MKIAIADPQDLKWIPLDANNNRAIPPHIQVYHFDDDTGIFDEKRVPKHVRDLAQKWMLEKNKWQ